MKQTAKFSLVPLLFTAHLQQLGGPDGLDFSCTRVSHVLSAGATVRGCRLPAQRFHSQHSPSAPSFASGPKVGPLSDVPNCPPSQRSTLPALLLAPSPQHSPRKAHSQRWNMDVSVWWYLCCCSCSFSPGFSVVDFPTYHSPS